MEHIFLHDVLGAPRRKPPRIHDHVAIRDGKFAGRAGVVWLQARGDEPLFTLKDWDGSRIGPVCVDELETITFELMLEEQVKSKHNPRPTTGSHVVATDRGQKQFRFRAGKVIKDTRAHNGAFEICDWDGSRVGPLDDNSVRLAAPAEAADQQIVVWNRPTVGSNERRVKQRQQSFAQTHKPQMITCGSGGSVRRMKHQRQNGTLVDVIARVSP